MLQTVSASLWALATLLFYQIGCDRLEGGSLRRRQLDAWAALSGILALGLILSGGASVGDASARQDRPAAPAGVPAATVPARSTDAGHSGSGAPAAAPAAHAPMAAAGDSEPSAPPRAVASSNMEDPAAAASESDRPSAEPDGQPAADAAAPAPLAPDPNPGVGSVPTATVGSAGAPAAPDPVQLIGVAPTRAAQAPTPQPISPVIAPPVIQPISPTSAPQPTVEAPPEAPQVPSPVCGDPRAIKVSLSFDEAQAERRGQEQVVRFRARLRNDSGFPIVASSMVAVAQDGRSSADQFGMERLPDVQIEALRVLTLEGMVAISKQPSPMSRSELCITFVAETCGLRDDNPLTRRCFNIGGF